MFSKGSGHLCAVALVVYLTGFGLWGAGFGSHQWISTPVHRVGLWQTCELLNNTDVWNCTRVSVTEQPAFMKIVVSFAVAGTGLAALGGAFFICSPISAVLQILAACSIAVCCTYFARHLVSRGELQMHELGWSYITATLGGALLLLSGLMSATRGRCSLGVVAPQKTGSAGITTGKPSSGTADIKPSSGTADIKPSSGTADIKPSSGTADNKSSSQCEEHEMGQHKSAACQLGQGTTDEYNRL